MFFSMDIVDDLATKRFRQTKPQQVTLRDDVLV
jgi:hypothetical protein